jgi:transcriptional regulator NrdR family protein
MICPKCKSEEIDIYDSDGVCSDIIVYEKAYCLDCGAGWIAKYKCEFVELEIFEEGDLT